MNFCLLKEFPYLVAIYNKKRSVTDKNVKLVDESITCHFKALKVCLIHFNRGKANLFKRQVYFIQGPSTW
jgi:hypothetical protein